MGRYSYARQFDIKLPTLARGYVRSEIGAAWEFSRNPDIKCNPGMLLPYLASGIDRPRDILDVFFFSGAAKQNALLKMARYFRREFKYDFVQYDDKDRSNPEACGFLFASMPADICVHGGCLFRFSDSEARGSHWYLDWIWLHPFFRQRGELKRVWPFFESLFGDDFQVGAPYSKTMEHWLAKPENFKHTYEYIRQKGLVREKENKTFES